jgi:ABC-2 type transport system permease protein
MKARRIVAIAERELVATVWTKGFLFGAIVMPILILVVSAVVPRLVAPAALTGVVTVLDRSGVVAAVLAPRLASAAPVAAPGAANGLALSLEVELAAADADEAGQLSRMRREPARLALVIVPEAIVEGDAGLALIVAPRVDALAEAELARRVGDAVVDARIAARGLEISQIRALTSRPMVSTRTITEGGEQERNPILSLLLPGGFMLLVWLGAFTAGQFLLTSLVEEKSSRVMEILLSAASPTELLTGKILGQTVVGLIVVSAYLAVGVSLLLHLGAASVLTPALLALLLVLFLCAMVTIGSLMAAVGSVVEDLRSAQSLLAPLMFVVTLPVLLWMPISRDPNGPLAVVLSHAPIVGPFVTVLRATGHEPPSSLGLATAVTAALLCSGLALLGAGRVFEVGVLLYGKPPSLRVMLRWLVRPRG